MMTIDNDISHTIFNNENIFSLNTYQSNAFESFPIALRKIVDDDTLSSQFGISWSFDGLSFEIRPNLVFEQNVVIGYFKLSSITEFFATLTHYKFELLSSIPMIWSNPLFIKSKPNLLNILCQIPSINDVPSKILQPFSPTQKVANISNVPFPPMSQLMPDYESDDNPSPAPVEEVSMEAIAALQSQLAALTVSQSRDADKIANLEKENAKIEKQITDCILILFFDFYFLFS